MVTLAKIIAAIVLNLSLFLYNLNSNMALGVQGKESIKTEQPPKTKPLPSIKDTTHLDVYLIQDENVITTIKNQGKTKSAKNINLNTSKKLLKQHLMKPYNSLIIPKIKP